MIHDKSLLALGFLESEGWVVFPFFSQKKGRRRGGAGITDLYSLL